MGEGHFVCSKNVFEIPLILLISQYLLLIDWQNHEKREVLAQLQFVIQPSHDTGASTTCENGQNNLETKQTKMRELSNGCDHEMLS